MEAICSGVYRVGDKLPSETELAKRFRVSRLVVREAIRYLELRGLIEVRQGAKGGAFVSELTPRVVQENMRDLLLLGNISVSQLAEVRTHVEPEVSRLAAVRATKEDLEKLEESIVLAETGEPGIEYVKNNVRFHRLLGRASHNPFYSVIMDCIMDLTENFVLTIKPVKEVIHDRTSHKEIYRAILEREPERAAELTLKHIQDITQQMRKLESIFLQLINKKVS